MCTSRIPRTIPAFTPWEEIKIPTQVKKFAKKIGDTHGTTRWLCWFEEAEDFGILARTFAYQKRKHGEPEFFETMREHIGEPFVFVRNMYYQNMIGWRCWFPAENEVMDFEWRTVGIDDIPGVWLEVLNPEMAFETIDFKYCGWQQGLEPLEYLRMYKLNPGVEFFGKLGIMPKKSLINKASTDGNFRKWLRSLPENVRKNASYYGPKAILDAFKLGTTDIARVYYNANDYRRLCTNVRNMGGGEALKAGWKADRVKNYIDSAPDGHLYGFYADYLAACKYLHLNLKDTKVAFPKDLRRMHDAVVNEMESDKAKKDRIKRADFYKRFEKRAEALKWCEITSDKYCVIIPGDPSDLVKEGDALHHCVGKCGYDMKMANGESFIAFVRKVKKESVPFVTVEFGLNKNEVRQVYGDHDSRPAEEVLKFVDQWAAMVRKHFADEKREETRRKLNLIRLAHEEEQHGEVVAAG